MINFNNDTGNNPRPRYLVPRYHLIPLALAIYQNAPSKELVIKMKEEIVKAEDIEKLIEVELKEQERE